MVSRYLFAFSYALRRPSHRHVAVQSGNRRGVAESGVVPQFLFFGAPGDPCMFDPSAASKRSFRLYRSCAGVWGAYLVPIVEQKVVVIRFGQSIFLRHITSFIWNVLEP